jgi:XTP/dITP diphosphohydrolase
LGNLRIVFASRNRHKYEEISAFTCQIGVDLIFGADVASLEVDETGSSYAENSILKAEGWAELTGFPTLADDSGLEVRAIDWRPGIYSARVAPNDELRNVFILDKLSGSDDRCCRYVAAFVFSWPGKGILWLTEGYCWGNIALKAAGRGGFGYDPIFVPEGYQKTFGELGEEVKSKISHRAVASRAMMDMLSGLSMVE